MAIGFLLVSAKPREQRTPDSFWQEQDEGHEDETDEERPRFGEDAQPILQHEKGGGAHERAEERPGAAEERHDDDLARCRPVERLHGHHGQPQRVEPARQPAEERREHERQQLDPSDVVPAGDGAVAVLANRLQDGPEGRVEDALERQQREGDQGQGEVVEGERRLQRQRHTGQRERGHLDAAQPIVTAGDVREMKGDEVEELREGERQHGEVDAAPAEAEKSHDDAADAGQEQSAGQRAPQRRDLELRQRDPGAIGAESPVGGVSERQQARVAVEEVEAESEEPVDEHLRGQRLVGNDERKDREHEREGQHGACGHRPHHRALHSMRPASPKSPLGRSSSTRAMTRKTLISASLGAKNVVTLTTCPMSSPATMAPGRLPMPPTTTTTNDSITVVTPISAYTLRIGPARMPARPASALPMPKTSSHTRRRSIPRARTISGSREPPRMTSPTLVRSRKSQSPTSTRAVMTMTKSR